MSLINKIPSVNYHLWEPCNMRCKFCFATFQDVKQSILPKGHLPKEDALQLIKLFADFGFEKITFVGGEPTLCPWLPELIAYAKELEESLSGLSSRAKRIVTERFNKSRQSVSSFSSSQRELQQNVYRDKVYNAEKSIMKKDIPFFASSIDPKDSRTFSQLDLELARIDDATIKRGFTKGIVVPDEKGRYIYTDSEGKRIKVSPTILAQKTINEDRSEVITNSVNALIDSGQLDKAKAISERYKNSIDLTRKKKISSSIKTAEIKNTANEELARIRQLPKEDQIEAITKIKDEDVRAKVLSKKNAEESKMESMRERRRKGSVEKIFSEINDKGFTSYDEFEDSNVFKVYGKNITEKDRKNIKKLLNPSKGKTAVKDKAELQQLLKGEHSKFDLATISPEEWQLNFMSKLTSQTERNRYDRIYEKSNNSNDAESASKYRARMKDSKKYAEELMVTHKLIQRKFGKFQGRDEIKLYQYQHELQEILDDNEGVNRKETRQLIKDFIRSKKENKAFQPTINSRKIEPVNEPKKRVNSAMEKLQQKMRAQQK